MRIVVYTLPPPSGHYFMKKISSTNLYACTRHETKSNGRHEELAEYVLVASSFAFLTYSSSIDARNPLKHTTHDLRSPGQSTAFAATSCQNQQHQQPARHWVPRCVIFFFVLLKCRFSHNQLQFQSKIIGRSSTKVSLIFGGFSSDSSSSLA